MAQQHPQLVAAHIRGRRHLPDGRRAPRALRTLAEDPPVLEDVAPLMDTLVQVLVSGASIGSIYALIALGIVLLYRTTRILNFAHGDIGVAATFIAYTLITSSGLPFRVSFLLALLAAAVIGMVIYLRSEERRVGKERSAPWGRAH